MAEPYIGEIRLVSFNFAPDNWALCNGALLQISQYQNLFQLIGNAYGGDGVTTFALPDLRSRTPIHIVGTAYPLAATGGEENVTLTPAQLPAHTHTLSASSNSGDQSSPQGNIWASSTTPAYSANRPNVTMSPAAVGNAGSSTPHDNLSPYLAVNFMIALNGIYPSH